MSEVDTAVDVAVKSACPSHQDVEDRAPCFAILNRGTSEMMVLDMADGNSSRVFISEKPSIGIVTIDNEVYAVTTGEILKVLSGGRTVTLREYGGAEWGSKVVAFQKKIYIIQPEKYPCLCFDPVKRTFSADYACGICNLMNFAAVATDDAIYVFGSYFGQQNQCRKFDPIRFNRADMAWPLVTQIPMGTIGLDAAFLHGNIYMMGNDNYKYYDIANKSWADIAETTERRNPSRLCVINEKLYAVGGHPLQKNDGFSEDSIEVYDKDLDQWDNIRTFETVGFDIVVCPWPHGEFTPDLTFEEMAIDLDRGFQQALEKEMTATMMIGLDGGTISVGGCEVEFPQYAIEEYTDFNVAVCEERRGGDRIEVAPTVHCWPSTEFDVPVKLKMRTCVSAGTQEAIPVKVHGRKRRSDAWVEEDLGLYIGEKNEIEYSVHHFSGRRFTAGVSRGRFHVINDLYIHPRTAMIAVLFCKSQVTHQLMLKVLHQRKFVNFALAPVEITGDMNSRISTNMVCERPENCRLSKARPASSFDVDAKFFQKKHHAIYYEIKPKPPNECEEVHLEYGYTVGSEPEQCLPLRTEWPLKDIKKVTDAVGLVVEGSTVNINGPVQVHAGDELHQSTMEIDRHRDHCPREIAAAESEGQNAVISQPPTRIA